MPEVRLTLDDLENQEKFALIDPGDYIMEIAVLEEKTTKTGVNAGALRAWVTWRVVANARGEETAMAGRQARQCLVGGWLINFLQAVFGLTKEQIRAKAEAGEGFDLTSENCVGRRAIATVTNSPGLANPLQKFNSIDTLRPLN